ncbi:unnamed protein product [Vitrella brassicaformis CCMP3155]|uniref:Leucine-rich repeat-containing N-terminal plant-type domain-containing protein n=2 Tax=Vitrella brassicaformis TaxID=1169539 RepID=A0A0G4G1M7_VITBC|nr:unnamed protein product [Vitrella brassicaformis CCMP3155]|eukprot:CEM21941.1 unnamed protein product [Vitrella brassicaformis CCMP3155]
MLPSEPAEVFREDEHRLLLSDGSWHRGQKAKMPFDATCPVTTAVPMGCSRQFAFQPLEIFGGGLTTPQEEAAIQAKAEERGGETDMLMEFFGSMDGPNWRVNEGWERRWTAIQQGFIIYSDPCREHWYGVTCNGEGYVTEIELVDNRLRGAFPLDFFRAFRFLRRLCIASTAQEFNNVVNENRNEIVGPIPMSVEDATELRVLDVSSNSINYLPDAFGTATHQMEILSLANNKVASLPDSLGNLTNLETLELQGNSIATLRGSLNELRNLRDLNLAYNAINDTLPTDFAKDWDRLKTLNFQDNPWLRGTLEHLLVSNKPDLQYISTWNTSITGPAEPFCRDQHYCYTFSFRTDDNKYEADHTWALEMTDTAKDTVDLANSTRIDALP